jgi:cyclophilin family peptidyl-prolyl cis-trans isomerase
MWVACIRGHPSTYTFHSLSTQPVVVVVILDNNFLDWFDRSTESAHPVFGKVIENYALVERISRVPTNEDDCPRTPIQMIRVTIV